MSSLSSFSFPIIKVTTCFHESSEYECTNFFSVEKENSLLVKKDIFLTISYLFSIPQNCFDLKFHCCFEVLHLEKLEKILIFSRLTFLGLSTLEKLKITLEHFFFTVGQNNYGNKIPFFSVLIIWKNQNMCEKIFGRKNS